MDGMMTSLSFLLLSYRQYIVVLLDTAYRAVDTGYWMMDTYSSVGLGKISVRSRTMVVTYSICFFYTTFVQGLYLTIVRQAPTS